MEQEYWTEIVGDLVDAKRCLGHMWAVLDGVDGAAPGTEKALNAALDSIDAVYAFEVHNEFNADVASPPDVQEFWENHESLPGFAVGT